MAPGAGRFDAMTGPISPPQYPTKFDPYADRTSKISPEMTIVDIYPLVMSEDPAGIATAANGWTALATQLTLSQGDVLDFNLVREHWDSGAGTLYADYVDGTVGTFSDWYHAATANAAALNTLSGTITALQQHMSELWTQFEDAITYVHDMKGRPPVPMVIGTLMRWWPELGDLDPRQFHTVLDPVVEHYTVKVRTEVLEPLNAAYSQAYSGLRTGQRFTGPTNGPSEEQVGSALKRLSAVPNPMPAAPPLPDGLDAAPPDVDVPQLPPGSRDGPPRLPAEPVAPVPMLPEPTPAVPAPPTLPAPPTAPPTLSAPVPPALPPSAPTESLSAPDRPLPPELPPARTARLVGEPVVPPSPAARPENDNLGRPALPDPELAGRPRAPEVPRRLRGRGGAGEPAGGRAPANPQLPGRTTARPKPPTTPNGQGWDEPPPRGARPALPGRTTKPRARRTGGPPDDDIPPSRLGSRPNLLGIRAERRPGEPRVIEHPAAHGLNGRLGAGPEPVDEFARRALRPGLGGRTADDPRRPEPDTRTDPEPIDFVGDAELFTSEPAPPAVIERPAEPKPIADARPVLPKR